MHSWYDVWNIDVTKINYSFLVTVFILYILWQVGKRISNKEKASIEEVNERYGALLEDLSFMAFGISERMLPYSRNEIENVLLVQGMLCVKNNDHKRWDILMACYLSLAQFISIDKYNLIKEIYAPLEGLSEADLRELLTKVSLILNEISNEMKKRAEDYIKSTLVIKSDDLEYKLLVKQALENHEALVQSLIDKKGLK